MGKTSSFVNCEKIPMNALGPTILNSSRTHCKICLESLYHEIAYSVKHWRGKTLANFSIIHRFGKVFPSKHCQCFDV